MKRISALIALGLIFAPTAPLAQGGADWSVNARVSTGGSVETNRGLSSDSSGVTASARAGVDVTIGATTKTSVTRVQAGLLGSVFAGPRGSNRITPTLDASHSFRRRDYEVSTTASVRRRAVRDEQIEDTGETTGSGTQLTGAAGLTVALNADSRNRYSISATGRFTEFSGAVGSNVTPTRSVGLSAAWLHRIDRLSSVSLSTGVGIFEADSPTGTDSRSINISAGYQQQRTSRHAISVDAGLSGVFRDSPTGDDGVQVGATGGASLDYRGGQWNGSLSLSQSVDSSNVGEVRQFSRLSGGLDYAINDAQRISLGASYSLRADVGFGGELRQVFSVGPNYFLTLTQDAALSLGYLFRVAQTEGQSVNSSHQLTLSLTRNFSLLP